MATIASVPELEAMLLGGVVARGPSITDSLHYAVIGCDLCDLSGLEESLALCGIEFSWPTLLLSECVLTYMQPQRYLSDPTAMHPLFIQRACAEGLRYLVCVCVCVCPFSCSAMSRI